MIKKIYVFVILMLSIILFNQKVYADDSVLNTIPESIDKKIDTNIYNNSTLLREVLENYLFDGNEVYELKFYNVSNPLRVSVYENDIYLGSKSITLNVVDPIYTNDTYTTNINLIDIIKNNLSYTEVFNNLVKPNLEIDNENLEAFLNYRSVGGEVLYRYNYYLVSNEDDGYYFLGNLDAEVNNVLEIPYEIRQPEEANEAIKNILIDDYAFDSRDLTVLYDEVSTEDRGGYYLVDGNSSSKNKMGIFTITYKGVSSNINIHNKSNDLTNIELSIDLDDPYIKYSSYDYYLVNGKIKLNTKIYPSDAIYEKIYYYVDGGTIDENGYITPNNNKGYMKITAYSLGNSNIRATLSINISDKSYIYGGYVNRQLPSKIEFTNYTKEVLDLMAKDIVDNYITDYAPGVTIWIYKYLDYYYDMTLYYEGSKISQYNFGGYYSNYDRTINYTYVTDTNTDVNNAMKFLLTNYTIPFKDSLYLNTDKEYQSYIKQYLEQLLGNDIEIIAGIPTIVENENNKTITLNVALGKDGNYYRAKTITFTEEKFILLDIPYEIRDDQTTLEYFTNYIDNSDFAIYKNEELSSLYTEERDFRGVYDVLYNDKTISIKLNNEKKKITSLTIKNMSEYFEIGKEYQLNFSYTPTDAIYEDFYFESYDETIFTVNQSGVITPLKKGVATLKYCYGDYCAEETIVVKTDKYTKLLENYKNIKNIELRISYKVYSIKSVIEKYLESILDEEIILSVEEILKSNYEYKFSLQILDYDGSYEIITKSIPYNTIYSYNTIETIFLNLNDSLKFVDYDESSLRQYLESQNKLDNDSKYFIGFLEGTSDTKTFVVVKEENNILHFVYRVKVNMTNKYEVPYELVNLDDAINYLKQELVGKGNELEKINVIFNEEMTNSVTLDRENFGYFDIVYDNYHLNIFLSTEYNRIYHLYRQSHELVIGGNDTLQIKPSFNPSDAIYEPINFELISGEDIISLTEEGMIKALKKGNAEIRICSYNICNLIDITVTSIGEQKIDEIVTKLNRTTKYSYNPNFIQEYYELMIPRDVKENSGYDDIDVEIVEINFTTKIVKLKITVNELGYEESRQIDLRISMYEDETFNEKEALIQNITLPSLILENTSKLTTEELKNYIRTLTNYYFDVEILSQEVIEDDNSYKIKVDYYLKTNYYFQSKKTIEFISDKNIELLKFQNEYTKNYYLFSNGYLYESFNGKLELNDISVKDFYADGSIYVYKITFDGKLKYNENILLENVGFLFEKFAVLEIGDLYIIDYNNATKILEKVIKIEKINNTYFITDENNDVYVYGSNSIGENFNNETYINVPTKLATNIKKIGDSFYLLETGELYYYNFGIPVPKQILTGVTDFKILSYSQVEVFQDDKILKLSYSIINKDVVIEKEELECEITYEQYYIDEDGNLWDNNKKEIIYNNVKQLFLIDFDYTRNYYYHFITFDNKLYRITNEGTVYYIIDKIVKYEGERLFVTEDNGVWTWGSQYNGNLGIGSLYYVDYPSQIKMFDDQKIQVEGIYIYENTKTHITIDDELNILAIVLPYNATNKEVIWSVSDYNIVSIDSEGKIIALKEGTVIIYAKTADGNYETSFEIEVHPKVSGIEIVTDYNNEIIGTSPYYQKQFSLYATVTPTNTLMRDVIWESSDEEIIKLEINNYCKMYMEENQLNYDSCVDAFVGNKSGLVTIRAYTQNREFYEEFTINIVKNLDHLEVEKRHIELTVGETEQIIIKPVPEDFDQNNLSFVIEDQDVIDLEGNKIIAKQEGYTYINIYSKIKGSVDYVLGQIYVYVKDILEPIFDYVSGILDNAKKIIKQIEINMSVDSLIGSIRNNQDVKIVKCNNKTCDDYDQISNGNIKTGYSLIYNDRHGELVVYDLSIAGEVNGDGKINYLDYVNVYNHIYKVKHPESNKNLLIDVYLESADISNDGKVNYLDYVQIYNKIKELKGGSN